MSQDVMKQATRIQLRGFLQLGGPRKGNRMRFMGVDNNRVEMTGVSTPIQTDPEPIQVVDPNVINGFKTAGKTRQPGGLPKASLKIYEAPFGIPLAEIMGGCAFNYYETLNSCGDDVSDHLQGWRNGHVRIYSRAEIGTKDQGDRTTNLADGELAQTLSLTLDNNYVKGSLLISQPTISALSDKIVKDVTYATKLVCAGCGNPNDGTRLRYACTAAPTTSPGGKPYVLYTLDAGLTWTAVQVTSAAVAEDLIAIRVIGSKLVVLSKTGGGSDTSALHYATLNRNTGVPGAWTKITTGFVGGAPANDMLVLSPTQVLLCADNGYMYRCENVTAGVTVVATGLMSNADLIRIKGNWQQVVAIGNTAAGLIVRSKDRGDHWAEVNSVPSAEDCSAVEVIGEETIWFGYATGQLYVTYDAGDSWEEIAFNGNTSGSIGDIRAATDEVLYFIHNDGSQARLFSSYNGGESFDNTSPLVEGFGEYAELTRIATPITGATLTIVANDATLVGTEQSTSGAIVIGGGQYV